MIGPKAGKILCRAHGEANRPHGHPATDTPGGRLRERRARGQGACLAVGEPPGGEGKTAAVGYAARPRVRRRGPVATSAKVSLLLVAASISMLASAGCDEAGQARGGAAAEAEAKREATREHPRAGDATAQGEERRGTEARAGGPDGAVARVGDAVARANGAQTRAGDPGWGKGGGKAPEKDAAGADRPRRGSPQELTLRVGGVPGTEFSGVCSAGEEETTIGGRVPERYALDPGAAGLECEVRKESGGALEVVISGEGVRSVQRTGTGEGTLTFALSEDGISSLTSSTS